MTRTRLKVCCIQDVAEAELAVRLGADCLGLVGEMPSGPGPIPDQRIADIARSLPPAVSSFFLTSRTEPDDVVDHVQAVRPTVVQLVAAVPSETYAALRSRCPWVRIVQVVHVQDDASLAQAARVSGSVDAVLLDSGRPAADVPELGGTGRTHDWALSKRIVRDLPVPVFLAGGLRPSNVRRAIAEVAPYGVDLCSGVRTAGTLDPAKLQAFVDELWRANGRLRTD